MNDITYRDFLDLMMTNDPWPEGVKQNNLEAFADSEAKKRGYDSWYVAFHKHLRGKHD